MSASLRFSVRPLNVQWFSQSGRAPVMKPRWPSKPPLWGLLFPVLGPPGWGAWRAAQNSRCPGRTSEYMMILQFVGRLPPWSGTWLCCESPLLPVSLRLLPHVFSYRRSFLVVPSLSLSLVVVQLVVVLVSVRGASSSGFRSAILEGSRLWTF